MVSQVKTKVLIVDAMCVENIATKTPEMCIGKHFVTRFLHVITGRGAAYDEIRIVLISILEDC